jgi:hypothetical protein
MFDKDKKTWDLYYNYLFLLIILYRHHHRLAHEGGLGVKRSADGALRFTRADGRAIAVHPQLPDARDVEGFHYQSIGAADWIIRAGVLDLDPAVSGIMRPGESGREVTPII